MAPAIRCTILNTVPCTERQASAFMKKYAASDFLPSDGVTSSYVHTVEKALRQAIVRQKEASLLHLGRSQSEGSQLKLSSFSLINPGSEEKGISERDSAAAGKRKKVDEDEGREPTWNGIKEHRSLVPVLNGSSSIDVMESKIAPAEDGRSRSRTKRKREKTLLENGPATTRSEEVQGTPDRGEEKKLAWEKVRRDQPVTGGQDLTPDTVKPPRRKKRKQDKAEAGV